MCCVIKLHPQLSLCGHLCGRDWVCAVFLKAMCSFALEENPSGKIDPR